MAKTVIKIKFRINEKKTRNEMIIIKFSTI